MSFEGGETCAGAICPGYSASKPSLALSFCPVQAAEKL
jgi:hypothetical protein